MKNSKTIFIGRALMGVLFLAFAFTGRAQYTNITSGGRFTRGSGTNESYMSVVIPLSSQKGVELPLMNYQIVGTDYFPWNAANGVLYHYNATNTASQSGTSGRIPFNEPIVVFGARAGGSALYTGQPYEFGIGAGQPVSYTQSLVIQAYRKSDFGLADTIYISIPDPISNTNEWPTFVTNGYSKTVTADGLTTTLQFDNVYREWGNNFPVYHLTHVANTNIYIYQIIYAGLTDKGDMVLNSAAQAAWSYLYTIEFQNRSPWRSAFVDQPQFAGQPMPPGYDGKTTDELLTNPPPVTNIVTLPFSPSTYTNIDQSPELRRHPILDQFVSDMRNDPIALTAYVQNRIKLVDPMALNDNGSTGDQSVNLGGVNRSALTTYLSGEGSPAEQCSLLIYLLRQAGYPAVYEYAPMDKLLMLDTRLSKMLRMRSRAR